MHWCFYYFIDRWSHARIIIIQTLISAILANYGYKFSEPAGIGKCDAQTTHAKTLNYWTWRFVCSNIHFQKWRLEKRGRIENIGSQGLHERDAKRCSGRRKQWVKRHLSQGGQCYPGGGILPYKRDAARWGRIFTTGVTMMGSQIFGFLGKWGFKIGRFDSVKKIRKLLFIKVNNMLALTALLECLYCRWRIDKVDA